MHSLAAYFLLAIVPYAEPITDAVDLVELNHYYDDKAEHVFDQLIFYDWCPFECRYQVRDWRLLKRPTQTPYKAPNGKYTTLIADGELRRIRAEDYRESWLQHDPELLERSYLPKECRRELTAPIKRTRNE